MKRRILVTFVALLALGVGAPPAGAEVSPAGVTTSTVGGAWAQVVNCVFTRYDPSNGDFTCVGSSTWEGAWTGLTHYDATGTLNPATGDMRGTLEETFVGTYVRDKSHGTLRFHEKFVIDGATSVLHIDTQILGGDGDPTFRCSSGQMAFDGLTPGPTGFGGYRGTWIHGCP
ncbi:MAG: hypothetical protein LC792_10090 [Actinobacteria bacterium]|nr:hypothetical protein [Actinomycetota bacterium]